MASNYPHVNAPPPVEYPFNQPSYFLKRQLFQLLGQNFRIYDPSGKLALFSHQKAFKLKEDIRIYSDESKATEVLSIKARQIIDFSAAYDVVDARQGQKVGALKRKGWKSIVRDHWILLDESDREIGTIVEDQVALAMVRRFLTNLVPQSYDLMVGPQKAVDFTQRFNPFVYHLDIKFAHQNPIVDRRLALAGAILLAAIEGRQS